MQTDMYHIRIPADLSKIIKDQAVRCDVSATVLATKLLRAAVEAIKDRQGAIIPPKFEFVNEGTEESRTPKVAVKPRR